MFQVLSPEELTRRISRLRQIVLSTEDLSVPVNYFFANLANKPELIWRSEVGHSPTLAAVLSTLTKRHFGRPAPVTMTRFLRFGILWHGMCWLGWSPAQVVYFGDLDVGIATIPSEWPYAHTDCYRFSVLDDATTYI